MLPGAGHFEAIVGDVDPAARSEAADRCATLLVRGARDTADEQVVARVVHLAETEGLDTLADLWSGSPADSLAGCLWRLYLLRSWVYADPASAAREFDAGRAHTPVHEVVAAGRAHVGASHALTPYDSDLSAARLLTLSDQLEQAAGLEVEGLLA
jgi:hypothetical protein